MSGLSVLKKGKMSVSEGPRTGRLPTSTNDDRVERVRAVIHGNHHLAVQEVADEVGISIGSCYQTFTEKLQMCRINAKFVPCLLNDDQKVTWLKSETACQCKW
jgi:AraC-like DNA-binding protein